MSACDLINYTSSFLAAQVEVNPHKAAVKLVYDGAYVFKGQPNCPGREYLVYTSIKNFIQASQAPTPELAWERAAARVAKDIAFRAEMVH